MVSEWLIDIFIGSIGLSVVGLVLVLVSVLCMVVMFISVGVFVVLCISMWFGWKEIFFLLVLVFS